MFHRCHKANSWLGHAQNGCPNAAHKDSFSVSVYCILFDTMFIYTGLMQVDAILHHGCYSTHFYSTYSIYLLYTHDIDMDWHMIGGFWRLLKGYSSPRQRYCHLNPQWTPLTNPSDPSGLFLQFHCLKQSTRVLKFYCSESHASPGNTRFTHVRNATCLSVALQRHWEKHAVVW